MYCSEQEGSVNDFPYMASWQYLRQFDKYEDVGIFKKADKKRGRSTSLPKTSADFDADDSTGDAFCTSQL
jgi:hypothetical protein